VYAFCRNAGAFGWKEENVMTAKLNLASNPFRNRALPWTVTTVITVVSIVALVVIARSTVQTNAQAQTTQRDVADLQKQAEGLNKRSEEIKTALTAEQRRTLKSAHTLVDRKRFSWSRLFADLEAALPGTVRVARIVVKEVRAQDDRTVTNLDLTLISKDPAIITQLIQDMERQGIFHAELVSQNLQRGKGENGAEYEMNVYYVPRNGVPIETSERNNRPVDTAGQGGRQ
jgi:Tfp pilus assembly protein PilN